LVRASHALRSQLHAGHRDGLEWAGYQLLFQLAKDGPQRSSALAASACVDPSTVSRQVGQLVSLGLVERRADPDDGRASLLAATAEGEARYRAVHDRRDQAIGRLLAGWPEDDVRTLSTLLHRLNDDLLEHRGSVLEALNADATATDPSTTPVTQDQESR
jgi:DNA-binding MarR family transcriptional regulator